LELNLVESDEQTKQIQG